MRKTTNSPYDLEIKTEGGMRCATNPAMIAYKLEQDMYECVDRVSEKTLEDVKDALAEKLGLMEEEGANESWYDILK